MRQETNEILKNKLLYAYAYKQPNAALVKWGRRIKKDGKEIAFLWQLFTPHFWQFNDRCNSNLSPVEGENKYFISENYSLFLAS